MRTTDHPAGFNPNVTLADIHDKYGSVDAACDAYLDRKMTEEEDYCMSRFGGPYFGVAVQRRVWERTRRP